jgi:4-hydroxy-2-oxoheptanedioate aldolase
VAVTLDLGRSIDAPLLAAAAGFDAIVLDLEHGSISPETTSMLCSAARLTGLIPLVRVASHERSEMVRVLDCGAMGIIVPRVETAAQAARIVEGVRYPPLGRRTPYPGSLAKLDPSADPFDLAQRDRETLLVVMLEDPEAIEHALAVAAIDGVDVIMVGPHDLAAELGVPGQTDDPRVVSALRTVVDAAARSGKVGGVAGITDAVLLDELIGLGLRYIGAGTDSAMFQIAARAQLTQIHGVARDHRNPIGSQSSERKPG